MAEPIPLLCTALTASQKEVALTNVAVVSHSYDLTAVWWTHPVVSCLVFVVDPVECLHGPVLDAVFGDPLVCVAAALAEDPWHHPDLLQVDLDPLVLVVELGQPGTPIAKKKKNKQQILFLLQNVQGKMLTGSLTQILGCLGEPCWGSRRSTSRCTGPGWSSWSGRRTRIPIRNPGVCGTGILWRKKCFFFPFTFQL